MAPLSVDGTPTATAPIVPVSCVRHVRSIRKPEPPGDTRALENVVARPSSPHVRKSLSSANVLGFDALSAAIVPRPIVTKLPLLAVLTLRDCF